MRPKATTDFSLTYKLTKQVLRNMKPVTDHLADLTIQGTLYQKLDVLNRTYYTVDIDFILLGTHDIKAVVEGFDGLETIEDFCIEQAPKFFIEKQEEAAC